MKRRTLLLLLGSFAASCAPVESNGAPTAIDMPTTDDDVTVAGDEMGTALRERDPFEAEAQTSELAADRDRLLDSMGARCDVWNAFDDGQRAQLLLLTDLLGKRSLLDDGS